MTRDEQIKKKIPNLENPIMEWDWEAVIRRDLAEYFDIWDKQKQGRHKTGKGMRPDIILKPNADRLKEGFPDGYFGIEVKKIWNRQKHQSRKIRNAYHQMADYLNDTVYPEPIKKLNFILFASNFSYMLPEDDNIRDTLRQMILFGGQRRIGCYTRKGGRTKFFFREFGVIRTPEEKKSGLFDVPPNPFWYPGIKMTDKQLRQLKITYGSKG